jgi:pimeloyl-ACP methyl ester carboxylesterase
MSWKLDETVETSAGAVAAGRAGSGPVLVLAHGWPWSSFAWHRIIPDLAKRHRVHWYDMPGYGRSEKSEAQRTSLDVQGKVFAEMLAHWDVERPIVVAHDLGGATTLRARISCTAATSTGMFWWMSSRCAPGDRSSSIMSVAT